MKANDTKSQHPLSPSMASQLTLASAPQSILGFFGSMDQSIITAAEVSVPTKRPLYQANTQIHELEDILQIPK